MKPVATVQLGVARLGIICSDTPSDADLGAWVRRFHRALALSSFSIDEYAAELLGDVEQYRDSERKRKILPQDSDGKTRKTPDSDGFRTQTDRQPVSQSEKKEVTPRTRKHPFENSQFFEFSAFRASLPDWSDIKCQHYHTAALEYSGSKGARYLDWRLAVMSWDRKEPFEKRRGAPQEQKPYNPLRP